METYRVVSITDRKGNPRIEGRYPLRVGRMCKKPTPRNGDAMMIEWLAQPDGTPYVGMIVTSTVIGFKTEDRGKYIEVTTRNEVRSTDLIDRGYGEGGIDFLQTTKMWDGDILTNPPYKYAKEFIEHAMTIIPDGRKVFMFLKLQFLEGKARGELFKKYPPRYVYVSRSRILCAKNGMFEEMKAGGGSAVAYAWYEFQKGYKGVSIIKWIN